MNLEKLKPWNWFKHENESDHQIPVAKQAALEESKPEAGTSLSSASSAPSSLLQLHQEMDRLFDDVWRSFGMTSPFGLMNRSWPQGQSLLGRPGFGDFRANLDIAGNDQEYEVSIDLPGFSESDMHIDVVGNTLTIQGRKEESSENKDKQYYRVERSVGSFQRTLSLPEDANRDDIAASMNDGVLKIRIPRKELPKKDIKRITISS